MSRRHHKDLKLLYGGLSRDFIVNGIRLVVSPFQLHPFTVEAIVFEEDTNLILTVDKKFIYQEEHPIRLMTEIMHAKTHDPGSLVINGKNWYAVVVDVNADEMCHPLWIEQAYVNIFKRIQKNSVHSIGISLLGISHVQMDVQSCLDIFLEHLQPDPPKCLKTIWLIVADQSVSAVTTALRKRKK